MRKIVSHNSSRVKVLNNVRFSHARRFSDGLKERSPRRGLKARGGVSGAIIAQYGWNVTLSRLVFDALALATLTFLRSEFGWGDDRLREIGLW
jgi:hypothetical protein